MKKSSLKHSVYLRNFLILGAIYLVMMLCFSLFLFVREKEVASQELRTGSFNTAYGLETILRENTDNTAHAMDVAKIRKQMIPRVSFQVDNGTELTIYTQSGEVILASGSGWECSYTEYVQSGKNYIGYGLLDPDEWFDEEAVATLESYLYASPEARRKGDISGYHLILNGFWVDNERIIPNEIRVTAFRASSFDEEGKLITSKGENQPVAVYKSGFKNSENLPYFEHGSVTPLNGTVRDRARELRLRAVVNDWDEAQERINKAELFEFKRSRGLTYLYTSLLPYERSLKLGEDGNYYSDYCFFFASEVNLLDRIGMTLVLLWSGSLIPFLLAAFILSRQSWQTQMKRKAIENQRIETANAMAHDLKTPLSIISGYAQNLKENIHSEKRAHYAAQIEANVNRMDGILRELLDLSRLEAGTVKISMEEVELDKVCLEILSRYRAICSDRKLEVSFESDEKTALKADTKLMERVIDNFFVNALDFTPTGGIIQMKLSSGVFELYNSGSHVPEEKQAEIWQAYKKADVARSHTKGTGLGLSIARTILESYNLPYGVKNTEDGVIFWFSYRIPSKRLFSKKRNPVPRIN